MLISKINIETQFAQRKLVIDSYHRDITDLKLEYYLSLWLQWLDKVQLSFQTVMCIAFPVLCVHVETTPNIQIYKQQSPFTWFFKVWISPCDEAAATWMPGWCNTLLRPKRPSVHKLIRLQKKGQEEHHIYKIYYLRPKILHTWLEGVLQRFQLTKIANILLTLIFVNNLMFTGTEKCISECSPEW